MSTELAIYDRITNPMEAVKTFGTAIHQSGMFGTAAACQGEVLAMECLARRMPPLMLAERYHIIFGKLSMKADATLAEFLAAGGQHEIIERSPERAAVRLTYGERSQVFSLTWDEAKLEPFIYEGKEKEVLKQLAKDPSKLEIKAKYQTPRSRMQMLWARVVSDGVRAMNPQVNCGVYTPEEIADFDGNDESSEPTPKRNARSAKKAEVNGTAASESDVIDVPFEDKPAETVQPQAGNCTTEQSNRLKELWGLLGVSVEDRAKQLAKRGAKVARNLTAEHAAELIGKLESIWSKREAEQAEQQAKQQADSQPCSQELADQVRAKLMEVEQQVPGTVKRVTAKVNAAGHKRLNDLTQGDVQRLLEALSGTNLEAFFGVSLWPTPKDETKGGESKN